MLSEGGFRRRKTPGKQDTISREEFLEFTRGVWKFPPESVKRVGHPAPFPEELPYRCTQLYTFEGDVMLDPFAGSGTTCVAAAKTRRHYICTDINEEYVKTAEQRIKEAKKHVSLAKFLTSSRPKGARAGELGLKSVGFYPNDYALRKESYVK